MGQQLLGIVSKAQTRCRLFAQPTPSGKVRFLALPALSLGRYCGATKGRGRSVVERTAIVSKGRNPVLPQAILLGALTARKRKFRRACLTVTATQSNLCGQLWSSPYLILKRRTESGNGALLRRRGAGDKIANHGPGFVSRRRESPFSRSPVQPRASPRASRRRPSARHCGPQDGDQRGANDIGIGRPF